LWRKDLSLNPDRAKSYDFGPEAAHNPEVIKASFCRHPSVIFPDKATGRYPRHVFFYFFNICHNHLSIPYYYSYIQGLWASHIVVNAFSEDTA